MSAEKHLPHVGIRVYWNFFEWHSLKTRVTLLALAIPRLGVWPLAFYGSRKLRADIELVPDDPLSIR